MQQLMIADSSDIVRKVGRKILTELKYDIVEASSAREALTICGEKMPNLMIVDAGLDGALDLITNIRSMPEGAAVKIYYCVIEADLKTMMQGKRAGANAFLLKPFDRKILTETFANKEAA